MSNLYFAVPLGVLRRFAQENKDESDEYIQLFELKPEFVFSKEELLQNGEMKEKGAVILDKKHLPNYNKGNEQPR